MKVQLRFIMGHSVYNPGEVASFFPDTARTLMNLVPRPVEFLKNIPENAEDEKLLKEHKAVEYAAGAPPGPVASPDKTDTKDAGDEEED